MVRKGLPRLYSKKKWPNFCVWGQFEIKIVIVRDDTDINTTYLIWILKKSKREPAIIWKRVNCQRITSKNTRPRWVDTWARDTVRWYWSADTLFWQLSIDDNIDVQSAFSWASKVARKCESKHWYACGSDGRSVARSLGHVITKFSGMGRFIYSWCSAGALRARSSAINRSIDWFIHFLSLFYSGLL